MAYGDYANYGYGNYERHANSGGRQRQLQPPIRLRIRYGHYDQATKTRQQPCKPYPTNYNKKDFLSLINSVESLDFVTSIESLRASPF